MYVFRRTFRYGSKTWGRVQTHEVNEHILEATPPKVKVQKKGQITFRNAVWPLNLVAISMHCWDRRSCRGRPESVSNCLGMPYGYQIW